MCISFLKRDEQEEKNRTGMHVACSVYNFKLLSGSPLNSSTIHCFAKLSLTIKSYKPGGTQFKANGSPVGVWIVSRIWSDSQGGRRILYLQRSAVRVLNASDSRTPRRANKVHEPAFLLEFISFSLGKLRGK